MKWFTAAWHHGGLSDEAYDAALDAYAEHAALLRSTHTGPAIRLLDLSLNDAQVQWSRHDGRSFTWCLLAGDQQSGYVRVTLAYAEAEVLGDVAELSSQASVAELVSDEVDGLAASRFEHRCFFWPDQEVTVRFTEVTVDVDPADSTDRR